ncbi:SDR family oxidoreductase [Nocardia cyriacigeorgica]|uniref:SDR family oxidoreductase n=1 Tax=Nocardia cyriacigeorgica TaxID=135487 RepID=A0A6P1D016_9NOCA|nr:SDR family NAD(P)-dependent oxidoreductase [Nocardia cyriacigeorgica]NEW38016.1 SDR family oxidoreductase [Nocardia cyriacigeorgica]NEW42924.1 SDR family oxidoreductase [Nocardia cyriacigeorgica]NEW48601.1 SDR family oxidoreductase [Nocardia cyriacigeorgica]NEW56231.1 SDR family oxidoreductase [Nocardia cyriacigeorgica]
MSRGFDDRVAVVTGGASGMGAACARAMAARGARVLVVDVNGEGASAVAEEIGAAAISFTADLADPAAAEAMVDTAMRVYGRLDIAVNAAGVSQSPFAKVADLDLEAWRRVISINLDGMFYALRAEIPAMLGTGGGSIVNIASTMSVVASSSGIGAYAAAKHGVLGLTRAAALEYAEHGIRINAVGPGVIETPMTEIWDTKKKAAQIAQHPIGRFGRVEEVAALVGFLCSNDSAFITGAYYPIDGGFTAK